MQCASKSVARSSRRLGIVFAFVASLSAAEDAQAADPSAFVTEILTPAGWELYGVWCGVLDELATSAELRTPEGWGNTSMREEPRWGGFACSEVVVPFEWRALALTP